MDTDRILGTLLGSAVGDALGMPVDGLSHQNVRTYYKGIKGYRADEHRRDLGAGQWTHLTQRAFALARALADAAPHATLRERYTEDLRRLRLRRVPETVGAGSVAAATPLFVWWARTEQAGGGVTEQVSAALGAEPDGAVRAAAAGQAAAVRYLLGAEAATLGGAAFFRAVTEATVRAEEAFGGSRAVSDRLRLLADHLSAFPLDLQDLCDGTGAEASEAWPFAVAMVARNPALLEATLLPALNVGGAASTVGALVGSLVGALHGWAAFPPEWREGLEAGARLEAEANAFANALLGERAARHSR